MDSTTATNNGEGDPPPSATTSPPQLIVHLLQVNDDYATYFHASSPSFYACSSPDIIAAPFEKGKLYCLQASADRSSAIFSALPVTAKRAYTHRQEFAFTTQVEYRRIVIGSLMLERRLADHARSAATVISRAPLIIDVPVQIPYLDRALFGTEAGALVDVRVDAVLRLRNRTRMFCTPLYELPDSLQEQARLAYAGRDFPSDVTRTMEPYYRGLAPIPNLEWFDRMYGDEAAYSYPRVDPSLFRTPGTAVVLNAELSEVRHRYQSPSIPAQVVEMRLICEQTLAWLHTVLAACCPSGGIPLFLAKTNDALLDLADDLRFARECSRMKILHVISPEKEAQLEEEDRSPYSKFTTWNGLGTSPAVEAFNELREQYLRAGRRKQRRLLHRARRVWNAAWKDDAAQVEPYDAVLATMNMALGWLLKRADPDCPVRLLLEQRVHRIVVIDAHLWSEAEIVALGLAFKSQSHHRGLQFVYIEDCTEEPPDDCYAYNKTLSSELRPRSAMDAVKCKRNIPITKLRQQFAPPPPPPPIPAASLYSDHPRPHERSQLTTVASGALDCNVLKRRSSEGSFVWRLEHVSAMDMVLQALKESGREQRAGTIIAFEEAFRKIQQTKRPSIDYDVLMLQYPGREPHHIVMLVITDNKGVTIDNHAFFAYPCGKEEAPRLREEALELLEQTNQCQHERQEGELEALEHGLAVPGRSDRAHGDPTRRVAV